MKQLRSQTRGHPAHGPRTEVKQRSATMLSSNKFYSTATNRRQPAAPRAALCTDPSRSSARCPNSRSPSLAEGSEQRSPYRRPGAAAPPRPSPEPSPGAAGSSPPRPPPPGPSARGASLAPRPRGARGPAPPTRPCPAYRPLPAAAPRRRPPGKGRNGRLSAPRTADLRRPRSRGGAAPRSAPRDPASRARAPARPARTRTPRTLPPPLPAQPARRARGVEEQRRGDGGARARWLKLQKSAEATPLYGRSVNRTVRKVRRGTNPSSESVGDEQTPGVKALRPSTVGSTSRSSAVLLSRFRSGGCGQLRCGERRHGLHGHSDSHTRRC